MQWTRALTILAVVGLACGLPVYGQCCGHHHCSDSTPGCGDGWRGCGHHSNTTRRSTPASRTLQGEVEAIQADLQSREGKVIEVNYLPGATPDTSMVEIRLAAGTDPILARIGPAGFLRSNQVNLREGDSIRLTGYWVTGGDGQMLVATQVRLHDRTFRLRDDRGRPAW
jgi:hypothetical protein